LPPMVFSSSQASAIANRVRRKLVDSGIPQESAEQYSKELQDRLASPLNW
jgi:hypothetical protein